MKELEEEFLQEANRREIAGINRRTLAFILSASVRETLPSRNIYVHFSLGSVYYYTFTGGAGASQDEIDKLRAEMRRLVEQDIKIYPRDLDYYDALDYFLKNKQNDTAMLINQRGRYRIKVNQMNDFIDMYYAPLFPRTGLISAFDISPYHEGFLLRFPYAGSDSNKLEEIPKNTKIFLACDEYKKWGRITGIRAACHINKRIMDGTIKDFIRINEAFQEKKLSIIADEIYKRRENVKIILIAGPSSSGKTTTAKRLSIQLKVLGIEPVPISLDDYYLHSDKAPKDENGNPDLECLEALDVDYFNKQLLDILDGKETTLPVFDFKTGTRRDGKTIRLGNRREVLLIEGIHGLNDALTNQIKNENKFKIYVSVLAQINVDDHNRVSVQDNRLLRRIVRDNQFRKTSALRTIAMWESVQRGAEKHIFRFENSADAVFNSALDYEIPVIKCYVEPLLRGIKPGAAEYGEASHLLDFLDNFNVLPPQAVPGNSILREFIGESDFKY
ncbi:MAG: nucleoside kinase [Spirochaetaceae bacterium]|jgi:uridine kinase|nr:nucleoside kinase [Spirochaetaceae bacterium]